MKIYLASSWRNDYQHGLVDDLRAAGHEVYDFKNPPNNSGFHWAEVLGPNWRTDTTPEHYRNQLFHHPRSREGFDSDMKALRECDATILALPCGRSAHLELGWAAGAGKRTAIWMPPTRVVEEPELMYLACDEIALTTDALLAWCEQVELALTPF